MKRNFAAAAPNKIWTAEISYVGTREGFLYLTRCAGLSSEQLRELKRLVAHPMVEHKGDGVAQNFAQQPAR